MRKFSSPTSSATKMWLYQLQRKRRIAFQKLPPNITKVLIDLSETAGSFYSLGTDFVATTDYSIEQDVYFSGALIRLSGNLNNSNNRVIINANGSIEWRPAGGVDTVTTSAGVVPLNKLSLPKVERIGSVGKIYVNETVVLTATVPTGSATINTFGNQNGVVSGGLISAPKLTDLTTSSNSLVFKLNEVTDNTETNNGVTLTYQNIGTGRSFRETYTLIGRGYFAPERIVGGNFLTPSDWGTAGESTVSGGRANIFSTTGSNTYVFQSDVMDEGKFFRVIYDVFSYTSGALKMSAVSSQAVSSDVGTNTIDFIALGTSILLQRASVEPTDIVIDSISIVPYIEVAPLPTPLFNSSGVLTCSGQLSCSTIIPCGE
jgi:hypothetical protein